MTDATEMFERRTNSVTLAQTVPFGVCYSWNKFLPPTVIRK